MTNAVEPDFQLKRHDRLPTLRAVLVDRDGNPADLTGADVRFMMRLPGADDLKIDGEPVILGEPADGEVEYSWADGDTDTAELYEAEFEVVYGDGRKETFPNGRFYWVRVNRDIGG